MRVIVVGLGNSVLTDDCVGLRVAMQVETRLNSRGHLAYGTEDRVDPVEIQVAQDEAGGWEILNYVEGFDALVLVDAILDPELAPGGLAWYPHRVFSSPRLSGVHDTDVFSALEFAERNGVKVPTQVHVLGIGVEDVMTFSEQCTPAVERAVPKAVDQVIDKLEEIVSGRTKQTTRPVPPGRRPNA